MHGGIALTEHALDIHRSHHNILGRSPTKSDALSVAILRVQPLQ
jgi:hypothetical protein